ncbi:MAG: hypothetical protein GY811_15660 [Myxococcales bacterium]|nr:hypothetical protein [Myxococcales bacterium]
MALRVSSPWWLAAVLVLGLFSLFMGERAFAHTSIASQLSWLGVLLIAGSVATRGWVLTRTRGSQRRIEAISILCHMGLLLALLGYWLTTASGISLLGIEGEAAVARWRMTVHVLWLIAFICSLLPLILIEVSLGLTRRSTFKRPAGGPDASVEVFLVREMASSGLSIALAAAFLMVTCNIADQRNVRKDVSYFKTSSPGSATVSMVKSLGEPLRVLIFFPENSEVAPEVEEYVRALAEASSNLEFEMHDRLLDADLAKEHRVSREGTIVLLNDDKSKSFNISPDLSVARKRALREFDSKFQKTLMSVIREAKIAYMMVGHGELNDPKSVGAMGAKSSLKKSTLIKKELTQLNYKVRDYEGFGKEVPDDCSILFILAPRIALLENELRAIDDYLAKGGSAVIAMDPEAEMRLELLQQRLGVAFNPAPLADDKVFMVRTRSVTDHSLILTNQFLSHASVSMLSRGAARSVMLFVGPGSFDIVPFGESAEGYKNFGVVRTMSTGFRDLGTSDSPRNYRFDKDTEKRDRYNVVVAVDSTPTAKEKGMRVVLISDADVLSDGILGRVAVAQDMLVDVVKWTGGEEAFTGETVSEKDKRIEHTKSQDAKWFYGTMVGAPLLMLGLGLLFLSRRRRKTRRSQS